MNVFCKIFLVVGALVLVLFLLSVKGMPAKPIYGVSFSKFHSDELKLDWKKVYLALLDDLKVRNFRFSAHWPEIEPQDGKFDFSALDFQMQEARKRGASVILAVGRRLPGWPECHEPEWAQKLTYEERRQRILRIVEILINRYKDFENIKYWQVENEPFLSLFARPACGPLDKELFEQELALVRKLDPGKPILITESGELSTWRKGYKYGDAVGVSMYLYIWDPHRGPFKYPNIPAIFRIKQNLARLIYGIFYGQKPVIVAELSAEPWLLQPIVETPLGVQLGRMDLAKFNEMIDYGRKTAFDTFYLWGAEWWYWVKERGRPEFWERARALFR
jgi:hypothetical protein